MAIDGFRLEFSDGTVFRATENVVVNHSPQPIYAIDGLKIRGIDLAAIYNEYIDLGGQPGRADSNFSGIFLGFGGGVHVIELNFVGGWEGSTDSWWDSNANDSAQSKMQTLNRAVTTKRMDSTTPGLLRVGEYEPNGKYGEIPVALGEGTNLRLDPEEHTSMFDGTLQLYECIDVGQPIDSLFREG